METEKGRWGLQGLRTGGVGEEAECRGREGVRGFVCGGVEGVAIYEGRKRV